LDGTSHQIPAKLAVTGKCSSNLVLVKVFPRQLHQNVILASHSQRNPSKKHKATRI